eukprot:13836264-Alexandrium_andersonii.AAC.1
MLAVESTIEGRHSIVHKIAIHGRNAGPVEFSLAERVPLIMGRIRRSPKLFVDLALSLRKHYHPYRLATSLDILGH